MSKIEIGKKINQLRKDKGITQEQLAQYCNVSNVAVSKWENRSNFPDISTLPIIARLFNITIDELLNFEPTLCRDDVMKFLNECIQKFQTESYQEAFQHCQTLVRTYPNSDMLKMQIAGLYVYLNIFNFNDTDRTQFHTFAIALLEDVMHSSDMIIKQSAIIILSGLYTSIDKLDEAETIVMALPKMLDTSMLLPNIYVQQGKYSEACKTFQQELYIQVNQIYMILMGLGNIANKQNQLENSNIYLELANKLATLFQLDAISAIKPITEDFVQNKQEAISNIRDYIKELQNASTMGKRMEDHLHNILWFQHITMNTQASMIQLSTEQILQFLDEKNFDYLCDEPEFMALKKELKDQINES